MALKEKNIWPKWRVNIGDDGRLVFENPKAWDQFKIPFYGKEMTLILKKPVKEKSRQEERYYHGVVVKMVAEAMEVDPETAHDFLKKMFLTHEEITPAGMRYERTMSTTELSGEAYQEYWRKCQRWASLPTKESGLGVDSGLETYIPDPNEADYSDVIAM